MNCYPFMVTMRSTFMEKMESSGNNSFPHPVVTAYSQADLRGWRQRRPRKKLGFLQSPTPSALALDADRHSFLQESGDINLSISPAVRTTTYSSTGCVWKSERQCGFPLQPCSKQSPLPLSAGTQRNPAKTEKKNKYNLDFLNTQGVWSIMENHCSYVVEPGES